MQLQPQEGVCRHVTLAGGYCSLPPGNALSNSPLCSGGGSRLSAELLSTTGADYAVPDVETLSDIDFRRSVFMRFIVSGRGLVAKANLSVQATWRRVCKRHDASY